MQGGASGSGSGVDRNAHPDWRWQLDEEARKRIVNKIFESLKRHLHVPVPEGLSELPKLAIRFEEEIYNLANSQPDYLRKISLKLLSMETRTRPGLNPPPLPNQESSQGPVMTGGPQLDYEPEEEEDEDDDIYISDEESLTGIGSSKLHEFVKEVIFSGNPDEAECCTICLEEYEDTEILRELHCGHTYHLACIARWIEKRPTCPVCKRRPAPCI